MHATRVAVDVTTDAAGAADVTSAVLTGRLISIQYVKPGAGGFTDGVDFDITGEDTTRDLWNQDNVNASAIVAPRQPTHDVLGVASLYAGAGEPVEDHIVLAQERVRIVIAAGGDTKAGRFWITVA